MVMLEMKKIYNTGKSGIWKSSTMERTFRLF